MHLNRVPDLVKQFVLQGDGWIVGSSVNYILHENTNKPSDWDILIPFYNWHNITSLIPKNSSTNSFGGIKIKVPKIDIWPGDIGWYLLNIHNEFEPIALHYKSHKVLSITEWSIKNNTPL